MSSKPKNRSKKVLILALAGIGNLLMQSVMLRVLKASRPQRHVTVAVTPGRGTRELAETLPYVDEVIELRLKTTLMHHLQQVMHLRRERFDIGIMLSPGQQWKGAAYLWLAGIPQRIGHAYPLGGNRASAFLLTAAMTEEQGLHDIEQNLRLLEPLGIKQQAAGSRQYELPLPHAAIVKSEQIIRQLLSDKHLIGFHMGSAPDLQFKRWPMEHWVTLGRRLTAEHNVHVVVFAGPREVEETRPFMQALGEAATLFGGDLLAAAAAIRRCELFVANDSGIMHLAAAVGTTTFGLFGPTDERLTGPRGRDSYALRAPGTVPVYDTEQNFALGAEPHETMRALMPTYVLEQLQSKL